jgi:integrase/recombinase XerD
VKMKRGKVVRDQNKLNGAPSALLKLELRAHPNIYKGRAIPGCMLYDFDRRLERMKTKIRGLEEKENAEVILKFLNQLFAEGLSKPRVLKYATHLKMISQKMGKNFSEIDRDDVIWYLSELEQSDYSAQTKKDYKVALKRFFPYIGKEDLVADIKTTLKGSRKKLPEELLTKEDVESLIKAAKHPRDKALIGVLYEGGLRIGELTSLRIKNVQFDEHGAVIKVRGKTGERRVRIVLFASSLAKWMEMHPDGDDKEAPLWVNLSNNYTKQGVTYEGLSQKLKRIAKEAGVKKKLNFHNFRHSRATHLAQQLTEAQMNVYFGWVQGSDMPATYVHLSGRDVDDRILQIHGVKIKDNERDDQMKPQVCPRCTYINSPLSRYCGRCGTVLDEKERLRMEMESRGLTKGLPDLTAEDAAVLEGMKKFRDLLELLEEYPKLPKKIRAMVEKT